MNSPSSTIVSPPAGSPASASILERVSRTAFVLSLAALFLFGGWLQANVHLNHDVGWITHSARWLLDGKRFGSDVVDPNPPLIWFLSLPAAAVARAGWLSDATAIRMYVWLLCAVSVGLSYHLLGVLRRNSRRLEAGAIIFAVTAAFTVLPGAAFGQREYLSFVLGVPYCLLVAGRIAYKTESYSRMASVGAGVLAGVGFGFKPWLLLVPFGIELAYLLHERRILACFRAESIALAVTLVVYLFAVVVFARDYLTFAIPLIRSVYWAYDQSSNEMLLAGVSGVAWAVALAGGFLAIARSFSAYALIMMISVLGYGFNYWAQRKGFVYHAYPVIAASSVLLVYACACATHALRSNCAVRSRLKVFVPATAILLMAAYSSLSFRAESVGRWFRNYQIGGGPQGQARQALIQRVNTLVPEGGHVYAFSTHPFPAFPTMNDVDAEWGSAFPCQFILPGYVKRGSISDPEQLDRLDDAVAVLRQTVLADFVRNRPRVVLVNTSFKRLGLGYSRFDDVAFYNEDPSFVAIWRQYRQVEGVPELPNIKIFVNSSRPLANGRSTAARIQKNDIG